MRGCPRGGAIDKWLQVAALEARGSNNGQSDTVEHDPGDERPGHQLCRCEGRIEATRRLPHARKDCRGRQQIEGGGVPESVSRHNQVDNSCDILYRLELRRGEKLHDELHNAGHWRS